MKNRHKSICAVFLYLTRDNEGVKEILLQKRINTGYMDGMYDFCVSGHLDEGETLDHAMSREAMEENKILIKESDLKMLLVVHGSKENYIRYIFAPVRYEGTPQIGEPEKCAELTWFPIKKLPENTIYHVSKSIECVEKGINYDDGDFTRLSNYKKEIKRQYCASVYVVDFEIKKTLLMYNKKLNKWLQPGGHISDEEFELPVDCCEREALEETGYEIGIIGNILSGEPQPMSLGKYINLVGNMIDIQYAGVPIRFVGTNKENNIIGWFSIDEMKEMNVDPEIIEKVEFILANQNKNVKKLVNY